MFLIEKQLFNPVLRQTKQTITIKSINLCLLLQIQITYMFRLLFNYLQEEKLMRIDTNTCIHQLFLCEDFSINFGHLQCTFGVATINIDYYGDCLQGRNVKD